MLFKQINILDENLQLQEDCYVAVKDEKIVSISKERLSYWDCQTHSFVFENCGIELNVGASSTDIRQTAFVP